MKPRMDVAQPAELDTRIDLRGSDRRVPEHFLHNAQIRSSGKQVGGKAMPQSVRADVAVQAGGLGVSFDNVP